MNPEPLFARAVIHRASRAMILFTGISALIGDGKAFAAEGVFSSAAFTGDADSGVSSAKTYITRANIIGGDVTVNGVTFIGSGTGLSGAGWSLAGTPNLFGGGGNHTTTFGASVIDDLFDGFQYNGNPSILTMSGLTAGQVYTVTLYNQAWTLPAPRWNTVTSSEGASVVYNQDALEASVLRYSFVATGASTDLTFAPKIAGNTFHFYGVSTEQVFNNTWTPASGNSWNTMANWSSGVIPNSVGANASFSAQGSATNVTVDSATTTGHVEFLGTSSYTVSGANTLTFQADAGGTSVLKADAGGSHTIAAPVQLNSQLAKFGAGTARLTGAVTGSGKGVTVGAGTLAIQSATADLSSLGNVVTSGTFAINNAGPQKIDTIISGTGGFEKSGPGVLTLGGHQTYSGPTVIQGGTVKLSPITTLAIPNGSFETHDPLANGNFGYAPTGATWTFTSGNSGIGLNGSPWFVPTNHDGNAGAFIQGMPTGSTGAISQTINVTEAGYYNLGFQGVARGSYGPVAIALQIDGTTVKTFDAAEITEATWQTYAAAVNLTAGNHTIAFVGENILGGDRATVIDAVTAVTGGRLPQNSAVSLAAAGATLDLSGASQTIGSLAGVAGTSVVNEAFLVAGGDGSSTTFAGVISGAGSFTKAGAGTMQLSGANTYAGNTTIAGGTLLLAGGTISPAALSLAAAGATLNSSGASLSVDALTGVAGSSVTLGAGTLTVTGASTTTFAGSLTAGGLAKLGNGKLTLSGPTAYSGGTTITAGTLKTETANTGAAGVMAINVDATWDLATASHTVTGLTGAGTVTRSGVLSTGADGSALISGAKNYALKLDFGNNAGATVNDVVFDTAGTTGAGFALAGAGTLFGEGAAAGYDLLVSDFYYGGNPGTLTFNALTPGQTYDAVLYTKVGHWANRAQNATFDEDGAGPVSAQLLNTDPGSLGYYSYRFVAHSTSMAITMAPTNAANTFHWFAASLENVNAVPQTLTLGDAGNYVFSGAINGPTKLIKQGSGIQELSGASNYSGGTAIDAGVILSHHASGVGTGPVSVANGANYLAWWKTGSSVIGNNFTLNGLGGASPGGDKAAIYADGGANGFAEYTLAGTVTLAATSNVGGNSSNNLRVLGAITGPGGLTKGGGRSDENNTLILGNPTNDYAGDTLITKGAVKLANTEVIPHGAGKGGVVVNAGTALDLGGYSETINSLSGAGTVTSTSSVGVPVYFTNDAGTGISSAKTYTHALDFVEGTPVTINGVEFVGAGVAGPNWSLAGAGLTAGSPATGATGDISRLLTNFFYGGNPAALTLSGLTAGVAYETRLYARQWGGDRSQLFTINAGGTTGTTIFDSDANGMPSYLPIRFTADATGQAVITTNQIGAGTYHWYGASNEVVTAPVLTVGDATSTTFAGTVTGSLGITKAGAGTLTLDGTSNYTGGTSVSGGKLIVNGSLSGTSVVNVSGGTLGGSGVINPAAAVTVAAGGEIAPGASIGTLATGPVTFADGALLSMEIGATTADKLALSGGATLGGVVSLSLALLADPVDNTVFTLIDGSAPLAGYATGGRFSIGGNSLDEGELFAVTTGLFSQSFQISYASEGGNDVTLLAVPEPASAAFLLLGATALIGRRRRA